MSATVGALRVDLGLNSAEFQQGMKRAEASVAQFGKTASVMGRTAGDVGVMTGRVMQRQAQLGFQLQDLAVQVQGGANPFTALLQQGSQVQAVYSGQGGLGQAFRDLGSMATGLVTKFWPVAAAVGAIAAGFGLLTAAINDTEGETVGFGDVAKATFQVIADSIYNFVQPAISAISGWFADLWGKISPYIAAAVNGVIGGFVGAFEAIKAAWAQLPAALGDLAVHAAQGVIDTFTTMGQEVVVGINKMINAINAKMGTALPTLGVPYEVVPGMVLPNPFPGAAANVGASASAAFAGAQRDYLGDFVSMIGDRARQNIAAAKEEVEALGGSAKAANDNVKELAEDGMSSLADMGKKVASTLASGFADMFKGLIKGTTNAMDAIGQLLSKLGDLFIDQAFNMLFSGLGGGGGGLFAGIGRLFGFANGTPSAPKGWAMVGERGPELVHFGGGEKVISNADIKGGAGGAIAVDVRIGVENGNLVPFVSQVAGQVAGQQIKANNKQLPNLISDYQMRQG